VETSSNADDARLLGRLESEERAISARRRRVHDRIDFLRGGNARRSEEDEARLANLQAEERELSERRHDLHLQIDALRIKLGQAPGPRERPRLLGG
jgi:predicted  nucleic acid-binding Zn-ribbon protein